MKKYIIAKEFDFISTVETKYLEYIDFVREQYGTTMKSAIHFNDRDEAINVINGMLSAGIYQIIEVYVNEWTK